MEMDASFQESVKWLVEQAGPVVKRRTAVELLGQPTETGLSEVLELAEVQRWFGLLGSGPIHHGKDFSAENCLAKLAEYGFSAGLPVLDKRVLPYCRPEACKTEYDYFVLLPFLIRLGYGSQPTVREWFTQRLDEIHATASLGVYDIYMGDEEKKMVPASLRSKRLYRAEFSKDYPLPSCYDFMTIAYAYAEYPDAQERMNRVLAYLLDGRFQNTPGGYSWDAEKRRHYAAGRGYLATLPIVMQVPEWQFIPENMPNGTGGVVYPDFPRLILFLEAAARLPLVRQSQWFQIHLDHLGDFQTAEGRFEFPSKYLQEKEGYYLYSGSHMGLAENRRRRGWAEIESTFRWCRIHKSIRS